MVEADIASPVSSGRPSTVYVIGDCPTKLWGISQLERFRRAFGRAGVNQVRAGATDVGNGDSVVLVRADVVLEPPLAVALTRASNSILTITSGQGWIAAAANVPPGSMSEVIGLMSKNLLSSHDTIPTNLARLGSAELASNYNHELRKRAVPFALSLSMTPAIDVERAMFRASYKGVTDFVTKWLWPGPAFWVTRLCAAMGISPNAVTAASLVLVLVAMFLFGDGLFLTGLVAAWAMTFLDTVDGKLARVTLTSSKWGNVFDHGIDLLHPPFWYWAWWFTLAQWASPEQAELLTQAFWAIVGGYILGRLQEGLFIWRFGIEIHAWQPIDSWFRLFTARRNPNLALLTVATLVGVPAIGFMAVAGWTVLSLLFHFARIGQAFLAKWSGHAVRSWLTEPSPATS